MGTGATAYTSNAATTSAPIIARMHTDLRDAASKRMFDYGRPEVYEADIANIERTLATQTELAERVNQAYEERMNPERAAMRKSIQAQMSALMDPNALLNRQMKTQGLIGAFESGAPSLAAGSRGEAMMQNIYGRQYMDAMLRNMGIAQNYLNQNPMSSVALDAPSVIQMREGNRQANINARNQRIAQLINAANQMDADQMAMTSRHMDAIIQEAGANAAAKTQASVASAQNRANMIGAGIGAAGSIASAGMMGGLGQNLLGGGRGSAGAAPSPYTYRPMTTRPNIRAPMRGGGSMRGTIDTSRPGYGGYQFAPTMAVPATPQWQAPTYSIASNPYLAS